MIYPERISKNELLELPLLHFQGKIHLVNDRIEMEKSMELIQEEAHPLNVEKIILSLCFNWPVKPMLFYSNSVIWGCPIP